MFCDALFKYSIQTRLLFFGFIWGLLNVLPFLVYMMHFAATEFMKINSFTPVAADPSM